VVSGKHLQYTSWLKIAKLRQGADIGLGGTIMSTPAPTVPPASPYLEQYKAYLGDLGNIGTRYATSNGFYLSVVTALLGILAYTTAGGALLTSQAYLAMAVPAFAIVVCLIWWKTIAYYDNLFAAKFQVLCEIEEKGQLLHIYEREYELIKAGKPPHSMLKHDRLVPLVLIFAFSAVLIYIGVSHINLLNPHP
jgi:hypothetical protein